MQAMQPLQYMSYIFYFYIYVRILPFRNESDIIEISSQGSDATPENLDIQECENLNDGSSDFPHTSIADTADQQHASSTSSSSPNLSSDVRPFSELDHLYKIFDGQLSEKQIAAVYMITGKNYDCTLQCLLEGPTLNSVITVMNNYFEAKPTAKIQVDLNTAWDDMLAYYKSNKIDYDLRIRIALTGEVAIDTGGVRRQIYTQVYAEFAQNKHIQLFDGGDNHLRPAISAVARSSGMLKILGKMLSHSIFQDGIGFPYLSPACYWYLIGSEDMAIEHITLDDLPADAATLIAEVLTLSQCIAIH